MLDPFCGSGTVLVEAMAHECIAVGCDTNPLAQRISQAKTTPLSPNILEEGLGLISRGAKRMRRMPNDIDFPSYWYSNAARQALLRIRDSIGENVVGSDYQNFFEVTLSSIVRSSSMADPSIPPPVKLRAERVEVAGARYERAFNRTQSLKRSDIFVQFERAATRNIQRLSDFQSRNGGSADVRCASALSTGIDAGTVDLVITSPPYGGGAQKYTRTFRLELKLLGYSDAEIAEIDRSDMGTERKIPENLPELPSLPPVLRELVTQVANRNHRRWTMLVRYLSNLERFAQELRRVLKSNGHAFVCLGACHFAGLPVDLSKCFMHLAEAAGLSVAAKLQDPIRSRGMITKRHATAALISSEDILWLRPN